jgi:hypothetical protein
VSNWEPVARRGALIVGQARAFGGVKTGTEMVDGMNKSTSHSASYRPLLLVAICILVLGGFGFLYCAWLGSRMASRRGCYRSALGFVRFWRIAAEEIQKHDCEVAQRVAPANAGGPCLSNVRGPAWLFCQ